MGCESSGVVGLDLGPLLQGETSIAKPKCASSFLQLKTHSQLIQNPFTGTDCFLCHYVITLRRGRPRPRPREQLLLQNYKA